MANLFLRKILRGNFPLRFKLIKSIGIGSEETLQIGFPLVDSLFSGNFHVVILISKTELLWSNFFNNCFKVAVFYRPHFFGV